MEPTPMSSENLHYLSNMRPEMPHKPVDMVNERVDVEAHPYGEHSEDFKWRHEAVMLLCSLYRAKKGQFVSGFVKKRDLWAEVAAEMSSRGFPVNYISCEKKWHNLCATFRKLKEYNRYSAKKRKCWAYYETMEEILTPDMQHEGDSMGHVRCQSPENSCHTPSSVPMNQSSMPMYGKTLWPVVPYRQQVDVAHAEARPRSCEQDITSMLSVTLEENNHSQGGMNNNNVHGNMGMPSSVCLDDFKWTHNSVMMLCSMYIARKDQFLSGTVKKRDLWSDIAHQMNQEGFPVTFTGCEKKWHNLIATYKKVVLYNKKKTWPYLRIFQKILEEQGNRMYNNSGYDPSLAGSSYNKGCPDNAMCRKMPVKQDMSMMSPEEQALYGDTLNNSNDSMDDFKWTHDSVILLCTLYKERRDDFLSNTVRKRDLWTEVANEMNVQGYCVTWVHCEKKWYNLYATYKKVTDHSRKRVRIWSTWPYLQLFQDIFCKEGGPLRELPPPTPLINHSYDNEQGAPHDVCSPSPSNSDRTCDMSQEHMMDHRGPPDKRPRIDSPPVWFLEYCDRQREQEERRHLETEQRHRELMDAIMRGNEAVKELSDNLKMFLNKCL